MKILLVHLYGTPNDTQKVSMAPMGLYYIGAMLKHHGYDVAVANWDAAEISPSGATAILKEQAPDVLGISLMQFNRFWAVNVAALAKQTLPGLKIVFGGQEATFLWELLLAHYPHIDFIVTGEGEFAFLDLVRAIERRDVPVEDIRIPGVALRVGGRAARPLAPEPISDLDTLPMPARYFDFHTISISRGCPNRCSYCTSPRFWGRRVRYHSAIYTAAQIELLYQRGITHFYLGDDTFLLKPALVIDLCRRIIDREMNITWSAMSRVDCVFSAIIGFLGAFKVPFIKDLQLHCRLKALFCWFCNLLSHQTLRDRAFMRVFLFIDN